MRNISTHIILVILLALSGAYIAHYTESDMIYYISVYVTVAWLLLIIKMLLKLLKESKLVKSSIGPNIVCTVGIWMILSQCLDLVFYNPMEIAINDIFFTIAATLHGIYEYFNIKNVTIKNK